MHRLTQREKNGTEQSEGRRVWVRQRSMQHGPMGSAARTAAQLVPSSDLCQVCFRLAARRYECVVEDPAAGARAHISDGQADRPASECARQSSFDVFGPAEIACGRRRFRSDCRRCSALRHRRSHAGIGRFVPIILLGVRRGKTTRIKRAREERHANSDSFHCFVPCSALRKLRPRSLFV